jgi:translation initiation factor 1 (eIF-1/SUI1)
MHCFYVRRNRRDGARATTRIKKISGDQEAFITELRAALQISKAAVGKDDSIRTRTGGTIEIKGNRAQEVKEWLAGLGF